MPGGAMPGTTRRRPQRPDRDAAKSRPHPWTGPDSCRSQLAGNEIRNPGDSYFGRSRIAAVLIFELAFLQPAVGDHDAVRYADQFPIGEHRAWAFATIVEQYID